jgi:hypothetical protein
MEGRKAMTIPADQSFTDQIDSVFSSQGMRHEGAITPSIAPYW